MNDSLDRRLAVWLNAYRDTKEIHDELARRTADKWLDEYPQDMDKLNIMQCNLRTNLRISANCLHELFGEIYKKYTEGEND